MMWEAWAHKSRERFNHVGNKRWVELHGLKDPIVPVLVELDPEGDYWGWQRPGEKEDLPRMIWPTLMQLQMCFPQSLADAEKNGRGRSARMKITERHEA